MLDLVSVQYRIGFALPIDFLYKMRCIVIPFVGDDTHHVCHLQRRGLHLPLANTKEHIGAGIPRVAVQFIVERCINDKALVFTGNIHAQTNTQTK